MKYLKLLLLSITLIVSPTIFAKYNFSEVQIKNMQKAYKYGRSQPLKFNGSRVDFGYIMAAIIWQETSAGINCGTGKHAAGQYQNLVTTVKSRMAQNGIQKSRAQITKELQNPNVSAHWARVEMQSWLKVHNGDINRALASYNAGWKHQRGALYSRNVLKKANYLKDNNVLKVE
ncbi:hypothetical protein ABNavy1_135 [Acinetobacter phage AB-Navy1]|uniref:Putative lytic murein transglycosylase n=1 Tax=Acinetobacter phage vB_AbaM_Lazarus TaxID=2686289 RepID=A0A6B9STC3_9CAUD|nr:hypothetical protein HYQ23_gp135 [Acinetobacter phage vB_AbaM_Lazarus]QHJ74071.1 putative lytic murein transglycosylase [Acinetobacter phage vB_AbaM_Lazarus]UQS93965.1 hypothetical protein ABNavy1_135 [Acinetobacter phage AB-Navy1]CAH1068194.1 Endoribonuclease RegB T4-bacteriophage encoded [Acinetobacter phage MD-2021a]CAH1068458.1 Endoribonuclease RegB T4-bacteriophage encoded [Acinetobacter phage MD-2021a]